jgi:4-amino-4-deoxy-L-arabinose transferase-like glycosyltransferase
VPVENGRPRLVKTPLPYWTAAGVAKAYEALGNPGPIVNDLTARLPSALSAIILCLVTLAIGRRLFGPRVALLGAIMLASCVGFQRWGRDARPEMLLCLMTTASMGCFFMGLNAGTRGRRVAWMAAFWVMMGLANLTKQLVPLFLIYPLAMYLFWRQDFADCGEERSLARLRRWLAATLAGLAAVVILSYIVPLILEHMRLQSALEAWQRVFAGKVYYAAIAAMIGGPALWYMVASRGWRQIWPIMPTAIPGVVVMLALFVPWVLYMMHVFPGQADIIISGQVTERASGEGGWAVDPPEKYLMALLQFTLPWVAFLPGAFACGLMKRFAAHRRGLAFLLLWSVGVFVLFAASAGKREHYIFPMLPAVCLLMGFIANDVFFEHKWITVAMARAIVVGYGVAAVAGVATVAVFYFVQRGDLKWPHSLVAAVLRVVQLDDPKWPHMLVATIMAALPIVLAGVLAYRKQLAMAPGLLAGGFVIVYLGFYLGMSKWDDRRPIADFARQAVTMVDNDRMVSGRGDFLVYQWGDPQAKMPFYFGQTVPSAFWKFDDLAGRLREKYINECRYKKPDGQCDEQACDEAARAESHRQFEQWIAQNKAPWIIAYAFGYDKEQDRMVPTDQARQLEDMGYAMEYGKWDTRQADKQNRVAYGLYHYMGAKSKPASQPAASQATTTSQPTTASQPAKAPQ